MADTPSSVAQALLFACFEQKDLTQAAQLLHDIEAMYIPALAKIQDLDILKFFFEALPLVVTDSYGVRLNRVKQSLLKQGIIHANLTLLQVFFSEGFHRKILGEPEIVSGEILAVLKYYYEHRPKWQPSCYAKELYKNGAPYVELREEEKQAIILFLVENCDIPPFHRAAAVSALGEEMPALVDAVPPAYSITEYDRDQIDAAEEPSMPSSTTDAESGADDEANIPETWDPQTPTPTPLSLLFIDSSTRRYCSPLRSQLDTGLIRPSSPGIT